MNFDNMNDAELAVYIKDIRAGLGSRVLIPAHHYVRSEVVDLADFVGDSYKLAVDVSRTDAEYIVFAGVRFMAEGAGILAKPGQKVIMPEPSAGCPMADMIEGECARSVIDMLNTECGSRVAPVVYMNSYIDSKAICGEYGGAVCTSSNAEKIVDYYLSQGMSVFFFPDFHLGKNVANKLGVSESEVVKINRDKSPERGKDLSGAKIFLWDGFCHVHQCFDVSHVEQARKIHPDAKIIVHPECSEDVVNLADYSGSTQLIFDMIKDSPAGTKWVVGTELNFVQRINRDMTDKTVIPLMESACTNMQRVTLGNLAMALASVKENAESGKKLINEITVDRGMADLAKLSLDKMIEISEK